MIYPKYFADRDDAGHALAGNLCWMPMNDPMVLGIPCGGMVTAAAVARDLQADLDVIISRRINLPGSPTCYGAISENDTVVLDPWVSQMLPTPLYFVETEKQIQEAEIARQQILFRGPRELPLLKGRTVIVVDDGSSSAGTLIAALLAVRKLHPGRLIAAIPVIDPECVNRIRPFCDALVNVEAPLLYGGASAHYTHFQPVEEEEAMSLLQQWEAEHVLLAP